MRERLAPEGGRLLIRRFPTTALALLALALVCAGSAAAATLSFDGRLLRWRDVPGEKSVVRGLDVAVTRPGYLYVQPQESVVFGRPGCDQVELRPEDSSGGYRVSCPLGSVQPRELRYRFSLGDSDDNVQLFPLRSDSYAGRVAGVLYAGAGYDYVGGDRVFGGPDADYLYGNLLFGGPDNDRLFTDGLRSRGRSPVAYGGPGDDMFGQFATPTPGWYYGGPGDDALYAQPEREPEMFVGGPGRDTVYLTPDLGAPDVVRLRGGGSDIVRCVRPAASRGYGYSDLLFVDPTDQIEHDCEGAHIMRSGRPRRLRPAPPRR